MYQALYRKWRPKVFSDVIGQEHITETLKKQVAEGRTSHAYLFTGTRGTGKTTCAKILAKAVNCEHPHVILTVILRVLLLRKFRMAQQ